MSKITAEERKARALVKKREAAEKRFDREIKRAYSEKHSLSCGRIIFTQKLANYKTQILQGSFCFRLTKNFRNAPLLGY